MDSQIEVWRNIQFAQNVYQLSQQKGSRLAGLIRNETFTGKSEMFDRLALATAQDKIGRNPATPNLDITHSRRMVTSQTRNWATLVDRKDKVQNLHDPENEYAIAAANALGRKMDSVILDKMLGSAATGEDGSTAVTLGNTQKIASVASGAIAVPNLAFLLKAKRLMDAAEVTGQRYIAYESGFLEALLNVTTVTSSDYNTVKALVSGELDTYLGFKFVHTELVPALASSYDADTFKYDTATGLYSASGTVVGATDKVAVAFCGDGVILGKNPLAMTRLTEESTVSFSMQVYAEMDFGAVRMEEAKVIQMIYKAS